MISKLQKKCNGYISDLKPELIILGLNNPQCFIELLETVDDVLTNLVPLDNHLALSVYSSMIDSLYSEYGPQSESLDFLEFHERKSYVYQAIRQVLLGSGNTGLVRQICNSKNPKRWVDRYAMSYIHTLLSTEPVLIELLTSNSHKFDLSINDLIEIFFAIAKQVSLFIGQDILLKEQNFIDEILYRISDGTSYLTKGQARALSKKLVQAIRQSSSMMVDSSGSSFSLLPAPSVLIMEPDKREALSTPPGSVRDSGLTLEEIEQLVNEILEGLPYSECVQDGDVLLKIMKKMSEDILILGLGNHYQVREGSLIGIDSLCPHNLGRNTAWLLVQLLIQRTEEYNDLVYEVRDVSASDRISEGDERRKIGVCYIFTIGERKIEILLPFNLDYNNVEVLLIEYLNETLNGFGQARAILVLADDSRLPLGAANFEEKCASTANRGLSAIIKFFPVSVLQLGSWSVYQSRSAGATRLVEPFLGFLPDMPEDLREILKSYYRWYIDSLLRILSSMDIASIPQRPGVTRQLKLIHTRKPRPPVVADVERDVETESYRHPEFVHQRGIATQAYTKLASCCLTDYDIDNIWDKAELCRKLITYSLRILDSYWSLILRDREVIFDQGVIYPKAYRLFSLEDNKDTFIKVDYYLPQHPTIMEILFMFFFTDRLKKKRTQYQVIIKVKHPTLPNDKHLDLLGLDIYCPTELLTEPIISFVRTVLRDYV